MSDLPEFDREFIPETPTAEDDLDEFGTPGATVEQRPATRDDLLDDLDQHLAVAVHQAVVQLATKAYPDSIPLEVIVKATELRLEVLRLRDLGPTTEREGTNG